MAKEDEDKKALRTTTNVHETGNGERGTGNGERLVLVPGESQFAATAFSCHAKGREG